MRGVLAYLRADALLIALLLAVPLLIVALDGTLDPATLDVAMGALERLQALVERAAGSSAA